MTSKRKAAITGEAMGWLPQMASTARSTTELKYPNGPVGVPPADWVTPAISTPPTAARPAAAPNT